MSSSLSCPKGIAYGLRRWPFALKVWLSFGIMKFHCSIGIDLMNGERTNPPRLEFFLERYEAWNHRAGLYLLVGNFFEPPSDRAISSIFPWQSWEFR